MNQVWFTWVFRRAEPLVCSCPVSKPDAPNSVPSDLVLDQAGGSASVGGPRSMEELLRLAPVAWLSVAIESRLLPSLALRVTPHDLAQEVLLSFWQARDRFEWQGPKALRSYLLTLADRAISDAADHHFAQKRGGVGSAAVAPLASSVAGDATTPSIAAQRLERAQIMRDALAALPAEYRECVRLRLFEEAPIKRIAAALDLPESTVRRRLRLGSELYMARLRDALASRAATQAAMPDAVRHSARSNMALRAPDSDSSS